MINSDNDPIKITPRKDSGMVSGAGSTDSENKPKKLPNSRKDFKDVLSDSEGMEEFEAGALSKADLTGVKGSSLMALLGKTYSSKDQTLTDVGDQKMLLEEGAEISPFTPASTPAKPKLGKKVESDSPYSPNSSNANISSNAKTIVSDQIQQNPSDLAEISEAKHPSYESPSALFSKLSAPSGLPTETEVDTLAKKGKVNLQFSESQPDISYINPNQTPVNPINLAANAKIEQTVPVTSPIHDVVVELIDKLTIIQTKGQTDTVVTLNSPGLFKGAIVVMSEFDTANGQLNLSFENLTSQAKNILDSLPNREALLNVLSERGYMVQSFVTTTITVHQPIISQEAESQFGKARQDNPQNKDQPKKQQ